MRALLVLCLVMTSAIAAPPKRVTEGRAIVLVVDRALTAEKVEVVRQAFKNTTFYQGDQYGVIAYGETAQVICPLGGGKSRAVVSTTEPTSLVAGLEAAHVMLRKSSKRERVVIVVTDRDEMTGVDATIAKLRADDITISAIGVESENGRALAAIARAGKGRHYTAVTSLAVTSAIQNEVERPVPGEETFFAYALVIDRSLSPAQLEHAKELARVRAEALSPRDFIAVVAFDDVAIPHVRPQRAANRMRISHDISRVTSGLATSTNAGLRTAFDNLKSIGTTERHVILYGTGTGADLELVKEMAADGITVSAVGF